MEDESLVETPGARIRRLREAKGISETQLGALVGVGEATIKKAEKAGPDGYPLFPNALRMAAVLEVSPWELAFGENAELEWCRIQAAAQIHAPMPQGASGDGAFIVRLRVHSAHPATLKVPRLPCPALAIREQASAKILPFPNMRLIMKLSRATILASVAIAIFCAIPAQADTFASTHCDAAVQTQDYASATVYCRQASEDYLVQASKQKGDLRATLILEAAIYLSDTGNADLNTQDESGGYAALASARVLLQKVIGMAHDPEIITLAHKTLADMPQTP